MNSTQNFSTLNDQLTKSYSKMIDLGDFNRETGKINYPKEYFGNFSQGTRSKNG